MLTEHTTPHSPPAPQRVVELGRASSGVHTLGGKGLQLDELLRAGFAVPPGYCITTHGFDAFLEESGAARQLAQLDITQREGFERAREIVRSAPVPESLAREIRAGYARMGAPRVAVRSSALGEDSTSHSFAGQHDTLLNVSGEEQVVEAVRECWASLWSDRAWAYRRLDGRGETPEAMKIAVVVEEMIAAESAGVIFTTDPVEANPDLLILEACWGLGEGLVAGRVTTDSYVIHKREPKIESKQIRFKVMQTIGAVGGGVAGVKVPQDRRDAPVLSDAEALELAQVALRIREHYRSEQDIEWARKGGRFYILQSRPITTRPKKGSRFDLHPGDPTPAVREGTLWSRMDVGEIFTGIMTPLGISFAKHYQYNVHVDCVRSVGVYDVGDPNDHMGYLMGHVYLNVSYTAFSLTQCPPTRNQKQFTERFTSPEVDLERYSNPYGLVPPGLDLGKTSRFWMAYQLRELATAKRRADAMVQSRFDEYDRFRKLDLPNMSRAELDLEMRRDLEYFRKMHYGYMPFYINAFGFYGMLEQICRAWLGDEGKGLQNRLKGEMSNLRTVEGAREVWKLAQQVRALPRVHAIVKDSPPDEIARALRADPEGQAFWRDAMEPFFRSNGTRGRQEMELTNPRWIDDPTYIFQMIRNYLVNDFSVDDVLEKGRGSRGVDTDAIFGRLPLPKRALLRLVTKAYSICSVLRELVRPSMTTSIWLVRSVVYEVGRRMVREGVLRSIDEVAYLEIADVLDYIGGRKDARAAFPRARIEENRRIHLHNLRAPEPPLTLIGPYDPAKRVVLPADADVLSGIAASPGRVEGKARVIHDLVRQADELKPGEILVTTFTDASWTPLFAIAGGVVTDIGSLLSHSSIVAREFNIPSVVNVKVGTQAIRTGDRLVLDGDQGVVHIQRGG